MAKKNKYLRIQIEASDETLDQAKNLLYTFKEQVKNYWVTGQEIQMESLLDSDESEDEVEVVEKQPNFKGSMVKIEQENNTLLYLEFTRAGDLDQKNKNYTQQQINEIINSIQMQVMKNRSKKTLYRELKNNNEIEQRSSNEMAQMDADFFGQKVE